MKTVLITGGTEGIGLELAKCFAKDGFRILCAARNSQKLQEVCRYMTERYHVPAEGIQTDLSLPDAAEKLFEKTKDQSVDILVNNAGTGYTGRFWEIPEQTEADLITLNMCSVTVLTRLFLKQMIQRREGIILNVASTGGFQPGPYTALYYASKSYVLSLSRAAAREAKEYGVKVSCLCPGPVSTLFYEKTGGQMPFYAMRAEKCAAYAYRHLGEEVIVPGLVNRIVRRLPEGIRLSFVERKKKNEIKKIPPERNLSE